MGCVCVCACVWRGKHVGSVVKKSLLDCWSTVEGCLPVSTPPGLSDLRLCLCVCFWLRVCNWTQQQKNCTHCVHSLFNCVWNCACVLLHCIQCVLHLRIVCVHVYVCGRQADEDDACFIFDVICSLTSVIIFSIRSSSVFHYAFPSTALWCESYISISLSVLDIKCSICGNKWKSKAQEWHILIYSNAHTCSNNTETYDTPLCGLLP